VGALPADNSIPWRGSALLYEASPEFGFRDLTGGYLNGGVGGARREPHELRWSQLLRNGLSSRAWTAALSQAPVAWLEPLPPGRTPTARAVPAGDLKLTMPAAWSTALLAWGVLAFPGGWVRAGGTADALGAVRWGTDYLLKTFHPYAGAAGGYTIVHQARAAARPPSSSRTRPAASHRRFWTALRTLAPAAFAAGAAPAACAAAAARVWALNEVRVVTLTLKPAHAQVGNLTEDVHWWGRPEAMTAEANPRPAYFAYTAEGASDLAGQLAGALAASSLAIGRCACPGRRGGGAGLAPCIALSRCLRGASSRPAWLATAPAAARAAPRPCACILQGASREGQLRVGGCARTLPLNGERSRCI